MNTRIKELENLLGVGATEFHEVNFSRFKNGKELTLGIDEFPHRKAFVMEFFGITVEEFTELFVTAPIRTIYEFINHLHDFNEN